MVTNVFILQLELKVNNFQVYSANEQHIVIEFLERKASFGMKFKRYDYNCKCVIINWQECL